MFMIIPLANLFLRARIFRKLKKPIPSELPKPKGVSRLVFWFFLIVTALIASVSFIPMSNLSLKLFTNASTRVATWFFPQRMNNAIMLWALLNGSVGLFIFFINNKYLHSSQIKSTIKKMLSLSIEEIGKTIFVAFLVFIAYFGILALVYYLFHVDYRLFFGVRTFQPAIGIVWLMYMPIFFIFFFCQLLKGKWINLP